MWARTTELRSTSLSELNTDLKAFDHEIWPRVEAMPGSAGSIVLLDHEHHRGLVITLWDTEEAMVGSRDLAAHLRDVVAQRMNLAAAPVITECEVERLVVPEGAVTP